MRIAYFTETFLPKIDGIVTRLTRTLEQLRALGHEALVFAPHKPPETYAGFRVVRVPGVPFRPWYPELMLGLPRPRLGRELDAFAPDIVHVVNPVILGLWGTAIAKQRNLPLLASFHTDLPQYVTHLKLGFLKPLSHTWIRDVHNQAHVNLCTSQPMVNSARGLGIKRVRLWPKAVDTERYQPTNRSAAMRERLSGGHPDAPLMIYVGRLSHEKRLDWLYAPITQLPGVRLAMVGSGPAESFLRERFKDTPTVFTGYMSGDELAQAYASADVFAFPSDTETLGFVAMEAMASGVPVVGARAGGIPDVIREGETGLMFSPGDLGDLTEKLRTLLFNPELRRAMGERARQDMERWSWRAATEALLTFYERAATIHRRYDPPSKY
ncbi:glycosyltransferase [Truepera radiovictrix]|uniref:Glycosyl transferase group 1 n=1 Tax=Truepera radiovictrix (strain DSM 17093 / CIP 108686 / LMG 22925 / RQ-24) TaxID=649638 RepID=D7CQT0_TRURR|nr:glycosyltransferase [Truepera radiovictrix]ADI15064.1 glycosyl transferase group 1 [Truepera radiovictrix DSM 17093]WMT56383.1 glycosyltransferase [Truepera radiovictrix]